VIREWARIAGYQCPDRGRIPAEIVAAYRKARYAETLDENREVLFAELRKMECCPTCGVPYVTPDDAQKLELPQLRTLQRSIDKMSMHTGAEVAVMRDQIDGLSQYVEGKFRFDGLILRELERIEQRLAAIEGQDGLLTGK
jgi:hypothetical protein